MLVLVCWICRGCDFFRSLQSNTLSVYVVHVPLCSYAHARNNHVQKSPFGDWETQDQASLVDLDGEDGSENPFCVRFAEPPFRVWYFCPESGSCFGFVALGSNDPSVMKPQRLRIARLTGFGSDARLFIMIR